MAIYRVNYDLRSLRDYTAILAALNRLGSVSVLKSSHEILAAPGMARAILTQLRSSIDFDDGMEVLEVADSASYNTDRDRRNAAAHALRIQMPSFADMVAGRPAYPSTFLQNLRNLVNYGS